MRKREKIYISSLKNTKCHDGSWQVVEVHWKKHKSTRPARADTTKNKCQCQWKHNLCRLYGKYDETINHLLAGCRVLTSNEYLPRDNWGLMLTIEWVQAKELIGKESIWYKEKSNRRNMFENGRAKLIWDFAYLRRNKITKRQPYLTLEQKEKFILLCDIACTQEHKIKKKEKK